MRASIYLQGGTAIVGEISIDPSYICGSKGAGFSILSFPVDMKITQNKESIRLLNLNCTLYVGADNAKIYQLSPAMTFYPELQIEQQLTLQFPITRDQLSFMEEQRHLSEAKKALFTLKFTGRIAGCYETEHSCGASSCPKPHFSAQYGMNSKVSFFHAPRFDELTISIPASEWVDRILPQLGGCSLQLFEVSIPGDKPIFNFDAQKIMALLAAAAKKYDMGNYADSVGDCRKIRKYIEGCLKDDPNEKEMRVAERIARNMGWTQDDDPRVTFIKNVWKAIVDLDSMAHHQDEGFFTLLEARALYLQMGVMLDYFSRLSDAMRVPR